MSSNFDEFYVTLQQNSFSTIALSETWLRDNEHLLKHLRTPGDNFVCNSRQQTRGAGVGAISKESLVLQLENTSTKQMQHLNSHG